MSDIEDIFAIGLDTTKSDRAIADYFGVPVEHVTGLRKVVAEKDAEISRLRAALEAEASKGERKGLERAAQVARNFAKEPARKLLAKNMNGRWPVTAEPLARQALRLEKAIRALIPEAPVRDD